MSHVSGRETRYLQALLWVSGSSRPSREEGLGLETGVGRGVRGGVCLWPPGTRSLLEVAITAAWDGRTQHWALVADVALPPVPGLQGQRVDDPWVQTWVGSASFQLYMLFSFCVWIYMFCPLSFFCWDVGLLLLIYKNPLHIKAHTLLEWSGYPFVSLIQCAHLKGKKGILFPLVSLVASLGHST